MQFMKIHQEYLIMGIIKMVILNFALSRCAGSPDPALNIKLINAPLRCIGKAAVNIQMLKIPSKELFLYCFNLSKTRTISLYLTIHF